MKDNQIDEAIDFPKLVKFGNSPSSPAPTPTPDTEDPSIPSNVTATSQGPNSVLVDWDASTDNVAIDYYRVRRFPDDALVYQGAATQYTDTGLDPETTYEYRVAAYDTSGNFSALSSPVSVVTDAVAAALSYVIDSTLKPKAQLVFGMDRYVHDYTGDIVTLERSSDNAQQSFGTDSAGKLDIAAIDTWRSGADVTVVELIDQISGTKVHTYDTPAPFITSDTPVRMGTTINTSNAALSKSGDGCYAVDYADSHTGVTTSSGVTYTDGLEFHYLTAMNERNGYATTEVSTSETLVDNRQTIFAFGENTNNYVRVESNYSNFADVTRRLTPEGNLQIIGGTANAHHVYKKFAPRVAGLICHDAIYGPHEGGYLVKSSALDATAQTRNTQMANGTLVTGNEMNTASTSNRLNGVMGAIIVTDTLTDFERFVLQSRMRLMADYDLDASTTEITDMVDEIIDFRNYNAGTGVLAGNKGNLTLNFNTSGEWTENYTDTYGNGVPGLNLPSTQTGTDNTFEATDSWFADSTDFTVIAFASKNGSDIQSFFSVCQSGDEGQPGIMQLGFDHATIRGVSSPDAVADPSGYSTSMGFNDQVGGNVSQSMLKYAGYKITAGDWNGNDIAAASTITLSALYGGETITSGDIQTNSYLAGKTDIPGIYPGVKPPALEQQNDWITDKVLYDNDASFFGAFVQSRNANYDGTSSTEEYTKTADSWLYVSNGIGNSIGDRDSSVNNALMNHMNAAGQSGYRIRNSYYQAGSGRRAWAGTQYMWIFAQTALTLEQVKTIDLNKYKFFE